MLPFSIWCRKVTSPGMPGTWGHSKWRALPETGVRRKRPGASNPATPFIATVAALWMNGNHLSDAGAVRAPTV
jgi:hypothetical protein